MSESAALAAADRLVFMAGLGVCFRGTDTQQGFHGSRDLGRVTGESRLGGGGKAGIICG